jgi:hypothetical protein
MIFGGTGAGEQRVGVGVDDRVVVDVGYAGARGVLGGNLVDVRGRGDAGADVEELGDLLVPGEVADSAAQEGAVGAGHVADLRDDGEDLVRGLAVDGPVVLPT